LHLAMLTGQRSLDDTSESSCTLGVTNDGLDRADKELTAVILFLFREEHLLDGLRLNGCVSLVLSFRRALIFQQNSDHSNLWIWYLRSPVGVPVPCASKYCGRSRSSVGSSPHLSYTDLTSDACAVELGIVMPTTR
jgi:hypothetical protein